MAVCRECYRKFGETGDSIEDDCCHGNRMSSPFANNFQQAKKSPLKSNNIPAKVSEIDASHDSRTLSLEKENFHHTSS